MRLAFIFCLLPLLSWGQAIQRQFWTTNTAPWTLLSAGTNAYVTYHLLGGQTNQYVIDVPTSFGQTNNTVLAAGTNVIIVTNASGGVTVYTVSAVPGVQTNVTLLVAGTNVFVHSATNSGVITYTIDVPTNAFLQRTQWAITDITNSLNLTNWALLSTNTFTNVIVAAGSNVFVTPSVSGQLRTYTVDVPAVTGAVYASNVVSGGILPIGTVATNSPFPGSFLEGTTGTRFWSQDGSTLTNLTGTNINGNLNVILLGTITNVINSPSVTASNLTATNLTSVNPATFQNGLTNAQGLPNALAVYGANTNLIGLANPANQVGFVAFNGTAPVWANAADTVYWREEFLPGIASGFWGITSGSGGTAFGGFGSNLGHPNLGYLGVVMGTAGSYSEIQSAGSFIHGANSIEFLEFNIKTGANINSGTNAANAFIGVMSNTSIPTPNGFYFQYDTGTTNWRCVTGVSSSWTTNTTSTVITANTWWKLGFLWDANTNITFYINGSPVYTNSTPATTPTGVSLLTGIQMNAPGTGSASAQTISVDYIAFYEKLGSSR